MRKQLHLILVFALMAGCAAVSVDLPSITEAPTENRDVGRVVWRDLLTTTPSETRAFYGELFGWTFERPGIDVGFGGDDAYFLIRHNGRLIGGLVDARPIEAEGNVSQWVTFISVDDAQRAVADAERAGATIVTPPTQLASRGTVAVLRDPDGALFAVVKARSGDPESVSPALNDFLWEELWTPDAERSSAFYGELFGLEPASLPPDGEDQDYRVLAGGGEPRLGILRNPFEGEKPTWVNYLRVADPAAVTSKVAALGGRIIVDAQPRPLGGTVALIAGPSGAGIALQSWPLKKESGI